VATAEGVAGFVAGGANVSSMRGLRTATIRRVEPWEVEIIRRSTVMVGQGQQAGLSREKVLDLIAELERLQEREKQARELTVGLRALLDGFDQSGTPHPPTAPQVDRPRHPEIPCSAAAVAAEARGQAPVECRTARGRCHRPPFPPYWGGCDVIGREARPSMKRSGR